MKALEISFVCFSDDCFRAGLKSPHIIQDAVNEATNGSNLSNIHPKSNVNPSETGWTWSRERPLDSGPKGLYHEGMTVTADIGTSTLPDLLKQVQAGHEVLLTQGNKPVAKIVPAVEKEVFSALEFNVPSIKGHRVLSPAPISQAEIAEEMFDR